MVCQHIGMLNLMSSHQSWQHLTLIKVDLGIRKCHMGWAVSQDIYQKKIDQAFDKCKGPFAIADDIQVYGDDTNHDMHLHEAMERTRQAGHKPLNMINVLLLSKLSNILSLVMFTPHREWCQILKRLKPSKRCRHHKTNKKRLMHPRLG